MPDRDRLIAFLDGAGLPYEITELRFSLLPANTNRRYFEFGDLKQAVDVDVIDAGMFEVTFDVGGQFLAIARSGAADA